MIFAPGRLLIAVGALVAAVAAAATSLRLTEAGDTRITETGDRRTLES